MRVSRWFPRQRPLRRIVSSREARPIPSSCRSLLGFIALKSGREPLLPTRRQAAGAVELTNRSDFRGVMLSEPALKPVGPSQHYVVCVQFNPHSAIKTQAAVYLGGQMTQFIGAAPDQCAGAAYQPFKELEAAAPPATLPTDLSDPRGTH